MACGGRVSGTGCVGQEGVKFHNFRDPFENAVPTLSFPNSVWERKPRNSVSSQIRAHDSNPLPQPQRRFSLSKSSAQSLSLVPRDIPFAKRSFDACVPKPEFGNEVRRGTPRRAIWTKLCWQNLEAEALACLELIEFSNYLDIPFAGRLSASFAATSQISTVVSSLPE
jgi:hypothetical protein